MSSEGSTSSVFQRATAWVKRRPGTTLAAVVVTSAALTPVLGPAALGVAVLAFAGAAPAVAQRLVAIAFTPEVESQRYMRQRVGETFDTDRLDPEAVSEVCRLALEASDLLVAGNHRDGARKISETRAHMVKAIASATPEGIPQGNAHVFDAHLAAAMDAGTIDPGVAYVLAQGRVGVKPNRDTEINFVAATYDLPAAGGDGKDRRGDLGMRD